MCTSVGRRSATVHQMNLCPHQDTNPVLPTRTVGSDDPIEAVFVRNRQSLMSQLRRSRDQLFGHGRATQERKCGSTPQLHIIGHLNN